MEMGRHGKVMAAFCAKLDEDKFQIRLWPEEEDKPKHNMDTQIAVKNLKCNGCVATIKNELVLMNGVSWVDVDIKTTLVKVGYSDALPLSAIMAKLSSLGYPEIYKILFSINGKQKFTLCDFSY